MDHRRHTKLPRTHHDIQYLTINELHRIVSHVEFDARNALLLDEHRKFLFDDLLGGVGKDDVEPIVTMSAAFSESVVIFDNGNNAMSFATLKREGHNRRRSTTNRAACPGLPSISSWSVSLLEMYVRVDTAWSDKGAFAIQHASVAWTQALQVTPDACNHTVLDTNFLPDDRIGGVNLCPDRRQVHQLQSKE
jgi:hypothetical protein